MIDPALYRGVLRSLEFAIQQALRYDPGTQQQIAQWEGRHICLRSTAPELTCHLLFSDGQIQLRGHHEGIADCEISGSLSDIVRLLGQDLHSLADTGVHVRGDVAALNNLQKVVKQVEIDWEQALADALGDNAAHTLAGIIRRQLSWLQLRLEEVPAWLPDYLSEELRATPSENELRAFYDDIQQLRKDVDRLSARMKKIAGSRPRATRDHPSPSPGNAKAE